jgi:hypothetical protein
VGIRAPKFGGKVLKGRIKLDNPIRFKEYLSTLEQKRIELILQERQGEVTDPQRRYYFAVPVDIMGKYLGYTREEMHEIFKQKYEFESINKISQQRYKEIIDSIIHWAATEFPEPIQIPDPDQVAY